MLSVHFAVIPASSAVARIHSEAVWSCYRRRSHLYVLWEASALMSGVGWHIDLCETTSLSSG